MSTSESIPFEDYGGSGPWLHFAHANGYPPGAYRPLFRLLAACVRIVAMRQRPLWPGSDPNSIADWRPLADDLRRFLDQQGLHGVIGAGHSFGAIHTLRLALAQPERFAALALVDPVLFTPGWSRVWKVVRALNLDRRLHPLVKAAQRRRRSFESREAMFANYRNKAVFQKLSDEGLQAYVDALGCDETDGSIRLCYPADWEAQIYVTGMLADLELWRGLPELKPPLLLIYGGESDTFSKRTALLVKRRLPSARLVCVPDSGHLVPLEKPEAVAQSMLKFFTAVNATVRTHEESLWNQSNLSPLQSL